MNIFTPETTKREIKRKVESVDDFFYIGSLKTSQIFGPRGQNLVLKNVHPIVNGGVWTAKFQ